MPVGRVSVVFEQDAKDRMLPFSFDLSESKLIYVAQEDKLQLLSQALATSVLLGIDTETKPNFIANKPRHKTSLIQIATRSAGGQECVFVVDLLHICPSQQMSQLLNEALLEVGTRRNCIKIGQGLAQDFNEMCVAYPMMNGFRVVHNILETFNFMKYLQPELTHTLSLKTLVKQYLNCNLVKTQQMSDWSRRPLTDEQLHYAACDALVLLRLYDAMCCDAEEMAFDNGNSEGFRLDSILKDYSFDSTELQMKQEKKRLKKFATARAVQVAEAEVGTALYFNKGWKSEAAKEWYRSTISKKQKIDATSAMTGVTGNKKDAHKGKATKSVERSDNSGLDAVCDGDHDNDDDSDCSSIALPLPTGQGIHKHFDGEQGRTVFSKEIILQTQARSTRKRKCKKVDSGCDS